MRKFALASLALTLILSGTLLAGCSQGPVESRDMDFTGFSQVAVGAAFQVDITRGETYKVTVTTNTNLFPQLDIRQDGQTLRVSLKQSFPWFFAGTTRKVSIVMPDLTRLEISGASRGDLRGFSLTHALDLAVSGASNIQLDSLQTGDINGDISGASRVSGNLTAGRCDFNVSGASQVTLSGSGTGLAANASGASRMNLDNFKVGDADIELSGASSGTVNASGRLDARLSGASQLTYIGSPMLGSVEVTGGSRLSQK